MGMLSGFPYATEWIYKTSKDTSVSFFATISSGTVVLRSTLAPKEATISYRCVSLGLSKGLPFGYSESDFTDNSTGYGAMVSDKYISSFDFTCAGYILGLGGTLGAFSEGDKTNGSSMTILLFGTNPYAGLRCSGDFRGSTPGGGVSAGLAHFKLESYVDVPKDA